jgi:transmembrane sensor
VSTADQEDNLPLASAKDVRAQASEWIARRDGGNWNAEDQSALDAWLAQSPAHTIAFLRAEAAWGRADLLGDLRHPVHDAARPARFSLGLKVAAAFAAIAMIGAAGAGVYLWPRERTFRTPIGGHETVAFADGSRIELNTNTVLRARMTTDRRIVWLDQGEAFFQVKHDSVHPFVVVVGNRRITDLGTKFLVRREPAKLEVAVAQGRVWFDAADKSAPSQSALLSPGDVALATATRVSVTRQSAQSIATELSWRRGMLVFKHTTLASAAAEFNRYNRQKLVVADETAASRTIGGTFPTSDVELFSRVVRDVLGLHVENKGNEIVISGQAN